MSKKSMKQFNAKNTAPKKAVKNNKRKVAEWVLAILILIWTIGTVLGVVGFVRTLPKASAEETQSTMQLKDRNKSIYGPAEIDNWYIPLDIFNGMTVFHSTSTYSFQSNILGQFGLIFNGSNLSFVYDTYNSSGTVNRVRYSFDNGGSSFAFTTRIIRNGALFTVSNLQAFCYLPSPFTIDFEDGWYLRQYCSQFIYNDTENVLEFDIRFIFGRVGYSSVREGHLNLDISIPDGHSYSRILIPLTSQVLTTTGEIYSDKWSESLHFEDMENLYSYGYQTGFDYGYDDGYEDGESSGYTDGFSAGETQGYNNGYNVGKADGFTEGVANANEYSFAGLLGSVIDVPVNAFKSLFNFEILGVNLSSFLMALLTIMIILAVTKLFI